MAEFNRSPQLPQPQPYTSASQGTSPQKGNDAFGNLFKDLGKFGTSVVDAIDENNKTKINDELTTGIDAIRGGQGVDAAVQDAQTTQLIPDTSNTSSGGGASPPAIDKATSELTRLNAAYKEGKIGDSQYWAKSEALVRQVRARYPGYREEIDKKVSQITGTTPANALRKSLLEDLEKAAQKDATKANKFDTLWQGNLENINPETRKRLLAGDRSEGIQSQVINEIATNQSNDAETRRAKASLDLKAVQGTATAAEAEASAISEANQHVMKSVNAGVNGAIGGKIQELAKLAAEGKALKPEDIATVRGQFGIYKAQLKTSLLDILQKPLREGGVHSYATLVKDKGKLDGIVEQALSRVDVMEQQLVNGDFGAFSANANAIKAMENGKTRELLESNEFFKTFNSVKDVVGKEVMGVWLASPGGMTTLNSMSKAVNDLFIAKGLQGGGMADEHLQGIINAAPKDKNGKPIVDPAQILDYLNTNSRLLGSDKVTGDVLNKLSETFYKQGTDSFVNQFQEGQRGKVYAKLTTPEITANMAKARGSNPRAWDQYRTWAEYNFDSINQSRYSSIAELPGKDLGAVAAVDENGRLRLVETRDPRSVKPGEFAGSASARVSALAGTQKMIDDFNRGADALDNIYKVEGRKLVDVLAPVYKRMGLASPSEDKESGNAPSPKASSPRASLGNQIQLTAFTADDNTVPGMRDKDLLSLEGKSPALLSLEPDVAQAMASGKVAPILNHIGRAEAPRGYNQIFGKGREAPLTEMTISDVYNLQRRMLATGSESTAVGRYQFLNETLRGAVQAAGLDPDETKFTSEVQDKLGTILLQRRGLNQYLAGKLSKEEFADNLAQEWAGFPLASGKSYYKGVGSNNATVTRQSVLDAIDSISK